ncbi:MAG: hypothetical protein CMJ27_01375 [Phycisphaerae bacterium]|nr:hypothetical protein [Phycisphaerae bacterium]OUX03118.1 MAG: hypothetical protein CBD91_00815 [Phycisphaeraceae bacterium TMED231]
MKSNPPLLIALAVLLLSGCYANTVTSNQRIRKDGWLSSHANVRVVRETEVSEDLLRIDIEVENTLPFDARFDYKFEFLDADGRLLFGPTAGFRQQQVPAGAFVTITATATDPRAADFRLTLTNAG